MVCNCDSGYKRAIAYATEKHAGQKRKGGEAYITHPLAVAAMLAEKGYAEEYLVTAALHDVIEDSDADYGEIAAIWGEKIAAAVAALSKSDCYIMSEYMAGIRENELAKIVKICDRLHNLSCAATAGRDFAAKYAAETREYFCDLDKGTPFEGDIIKAVEKLEITIG